MVCGPTASGKTALAVRLAAVLDAEIISADSRQVYRGLDIGSGKDLREYAAPGRQIPFHLINIADPRDTYTLYNYQNDFYRSFAEVRQRSRLPLLCGGTGLFIEAVLSGYSLPEVPEDPPLRELMMQRPHHELENTLRMLDPGQFSRTDLSSKKRIVRAIEVATFRKNRPAPDPSAPRPAIVPCILCTRWERAVLHERIDRRLDARLQEGMVEEIRALRGGDLPDNRLFMLGMEYKHVTRHLRGETDYCTMIKELRRAIYQLAKRQETWFRGMERRGSTIHWIDNADAGQAIGVVGEFFGKQEPPLI